MKRLKIEETNGLGKNEEILNAFLASFASLEHLTVSRENQGREMDQPPAQKWAAIQSHGQTLRVLSIDTFLRGFDDVNDTTSSRDLDKVTFRNLCMNYPCLKQLAIPIPGIGNDCVDMKDVSPITVCRSFQWHLRSC